MVKNIRSEIAYGALGGVECKNGGKLGSECFLGGKYENFVFGLRFKISIESLWDQLKMPMELISVKKS